MNESFNASDLQQLDELHTPRITRILTNDFPMYFAVVTRVRQEVHLGLLDYSRICKNISYFWKIESQKINYVHLLQNYELCFYHLLNLFRIHLTQIKSKFFLNFRKASINNILVGPEGGVILSSVVPQVQAIFPDGSLTKNIKVSVQAQPVPHEIVKV